MCMFTSIDEIQRLMETESYIADRALATTIFLALKLEKPIFLEGEAGVGKTEVAKVLSKILGAKLIRLQCYEGLDVSTALYEWNYSKQLLHIKLEEGSGHTLAQKEAAIFSEPFLLKRPLLQAISQDEQPPLLLIDEIDRCVSAGTLIVTTAGIKRAEDVRPGHELASFDPADFRLARATVKKVIPRETSTIMRVLVGGRLLEVTPEHRFVRYSDAGHELAKASELRVGDRLPLHKGLYPGKMHEPQFDFSDHIVTLTEPGYTQGLRICQSVAFYEVLGYIVADGCFSSSRLCIADKDKRDLEVYAAKFAEAFGEWPKIQQGLHRNYELTYHSPPLARFLAQVLGRGLARSQERNVPDFVFSLPAEKRAGFVRGFFDGEGWVGHHQVSAASASPYLLVGMQHVLSSLGVDSHISQLRTPSQNFGKGRYFVLTIWDVPAFVETVGFCSPARQVLIERRPARTFTRTETLPRRSGVNALHLLRERTVLHGESSHQPIYDVLAGRIRPHVSSLRRISAPFVAPELQDLLDRDVVLAQVTSVETLEAPQTVYDFVLEQHPYFIANQVVTHNCDEEFEAFLLEVLSDFQITIPEIGTIKAERRPFVILTSNRTREIHDALKRRCLYLWLDYPSFEKEYQIVMARIPGVRQSLAEQICHFMQKLRQINFYKRPGIAETLDWTQALLHLNQQTLVPETVKETLGCILKYHEDVEKFKREEIERVLMEF